ncbi:MAG: type I 3-dehydroquinate dehydratase [Clostridiales bacterium]|nr:type I 3-dehydroquinate dehydratase [Clostridiales bacterium]
MKKLHIGNIVIGEGLPKICVPIVAKDIDEVRNQAVKIVDSSADLVEFRIDFLDKSRDIENILNGLKVIKDITNKCVIVTFRTGFEGGNEEISRDEYEKLIIDILENENVDIIDVEMFTGDEAVERIVNAAHSRNAKVIMSNHDFQKTPDSEEIIKRLEKMESLRADIAKIAVMPKDKSDVNRLIYATVTSDKRLAIPVVTMSMGEDGKISRLIGEISGSTITFGTVGKASAPGQVESGELKKFLEKVHNEAGYYTEMVEKMCNVCGMEIRMKNLDYNIMLIGFMGAGKTTVSTRLSKDMSLPEIDMDAYIVKSKNMKISEIFDKYGEEGFRTIETECLIEIMKNKGNIVSCGGGAVLKDENVEYMKENGVIVLLTATPQTIYERVKNSNDRPILNGNMNVEFIEQLMNKRKSRYLEVADIIIETDNKSIADISKEIQSKLVEFAKK